MKLALGLTALLTLLVSVSGPLTQPAAATPTGKCVASCQSWCAAHARAQDYCVAKCTANHCG